MEHTEYEGSELEARRTVMVAHTKRLFRNSSGAAAAHTSVTVTVARAARLGLGPGVHHDGL